MDRSLAKGYANQFLGQLTPHGDVLACHHSPRKAKALQSFTESSLSKKPGRVLERLRPLLAPVFGTPRVVSWSRKGESVVTALAASSARQSAVLHPEDQGLTLFDERAAFLNHVVFRAERENAEVYGATTGAMGPHAIARLRERNLATPDELPKAAWGLLFRANCVQIGLDRAGLDVDRPWSLLFPMPGGAAGAVTHRVKPWPDSNPGHVVLVASVRTVLREDMLTPDQKDRMEGFEALFQSTNHNTEAFEAWIRRNARPWVQSVPAVAPEVVAEPQPEEPPPC